MPLLGLGALSLLMLSIGWLTLFRSVPSGLAMTAVLGGATGALLAAGLALWGRAYRRNVAGLLLLGIGCQVAMVAAVFVLTLDGGLGGLVPADFDVAVYRAVAAGSTVSATGLVGIGVALLAPATVRLVRQVLAIDRPVFVWAVLAWEVHVAVSALASIAFLQTYGDALPPEFQRYVAEARPYALPWSLAVATLGLVGATLLVRLRRRALGWFVAQVGMRAVHVLLYRPFEPPPGVPGIPWVLAVGHVYAIDVAILGYVVWLDRRGHLVRGGRPLGAAPR